MENTLCFLQQERQKPRSEDTPYIVLSQEYYSRIFDPRKEVARSPQPIIKKK